MPKLAPILLAEDDPNDVLFFSCAMKQAGLPNPLVVARDGRQAVEFLELLANYRDRLLHPLPALMLLDLKMPRLSGFEVLAWLQTRPHLRSVPVVVLSSSPQAPDMLISREFGAADYRVKPSRLENYVDLLNEMRTRWLVSKTPLSAPPSPSIPSSKSASPRMGIVWNESAPDRSAQSQLA